MNRRKVLFKLSLTEFIYNGCFAAANFLSVFLESIGFSAGQIGLTMSLIMRRYMVRHSCESIS